MKYYVYKGKEKIIQEKERKKRENITGKKYCGSFNAIKIEK